ncbi:hypothetical protein Kpol_1054p2 [Vanderwaltozyma polyspora DSM 70294]|uniref:non-specific serine/threonine protein kinase n=1 Tax=Vanderwaltozyma polyspora (strain ATCC 22028 / DSM 70294 / BCRC 21397 / CBS 2163 / NBRC 10782 / NRRL Y-8283 / UCD 57-17) TaxID=436907 RepID=A7TI91_VANPO|nr:uncharacterized protein Kpol_1054p2 [Vanderwaltozyma polyspora DSM 70294]EDO17957.1 hypothetical protein Kpol_1054p2 [Vanderwaltozyma polyspora DSM 70294]
MTFAEEELNSMSRPLLPTDEEHLNEQLSRQQSYQQASGLLNTKRINPLSSPMRSTSNLNIAASLQQRGLDQREKALTDTDNFIQMYSKQARGNRISDDKINEQDSLDESLDEVLEDEEEVITLDSLDLGYNGLNSSETPEPLHIHRQRPSEQQQQSSRYATQSDGISVTTAMKQRQESWAERGAAKVVREVTNPETGSKSKQVILKGIKDFKFGEVLGDGSYSTVMLATSIETKKKYAVKVLSKEYLIKQKKVKYVNIEKNALQKLNNSRGIVRLFFTFQDEASLYFLLEYAPNGDFLSLIKKFGSMNEDCASYYSAQIIDAIHFVHSRGIIHRDIKPENILLDSEMKVKLTDFGTAKILEPKSSSSSSKHETYDLLTRSKSFVGTAEYVSPELLNDSYADSRCDIWAFGCIVFQMIAGKPPFKATNEYLTFQKVMKVQYAFTAGFPLVIRDLVKRILIKAPEQRLTISQIKKHHFLSDRNFSDGSVWNLAAPELQPYRVSAKSMQPVPALRDNTGANPKRPLLALQKRPNSRGASPSTPVPPKSPSPVSHSTEKPAQKKVMDERTAHILETARKEISNRKANSSRTPSGAAYAASAALTKKAVTSTPPNGSRISSASSASNNSMKNANASEPVLVTNSPLSPTIPRSSSLRSISSLSSHSAHGKAKQSEKPAHPHKLDSEWSWLLESNDDHVVKFGEMILSVMDTAVLEKKVHKVSGHIINPNTFGAQRTTLLSQVARNGGGITGLRSDPNYAILKEENYYQENPIDYENITKEYKYPMTHNAAFATDVDPNSVVSHPAPLTPTASNNSDDSSFGKFRKLFHHKPDAVGETVLWDNAYKRMFVLTTHGHLFILTKRNTPNTTDNSYYDICYKIFLYQTSTKVKELVIPSQTDPNHNSCYGAVETPYKSFVFKYRDQDSKSWFNAFKKSIKINHERHVGKAKREDNDGISNAAKAANIASPVLPRERTPKALPVSQQSPVLHQSHFIKENKTSSAPIVTSPTGRSSRLFDSFVSSRDKSKKSAVPVPTSSKLTNGLPSNVEHTPAGLGLTSLQSKFISSSEPSTGHIKNSKGLLKKTVNASNSRFLARSERSLRNK